MDAFVPTNCRTVYRERTIHVTQRSPRAYPELAQLTAAVQSVGCGATWTHLKHVVHSWYPYWERSHISRNNTWIKSLAFVHSRVIFLCSILACCLQLCECACSPVDVCDGCARLFQESSI